MNRLCSSLNIGRCYIISFLAFLTSGFTTELSCLFRNSSICFFVFPTGLTPKVNQSRWNFLTVDWEVFCKEGCFVACCLAADDVTASNMKLWSGDSSSSPESSKVELSCLFICYFNHRFSFENIFILKFKLFIQFVFLCIIQPLLLLSIFLKSFSSYLPGLPQLPFSISSNLPFSPVHILIFR